MKPLTNTELQTISHTLQALVGAQLQEARQTETEFGLGFYHNQAMVWLWFDLDPRAPLVIYFEDRPPPKRPKLSKPLLLFARAHLIGRRLQTVAMEKDAGRILEFEFFSSENEPRILEARLFPHGQNLTIISGEKKISWTKPKDLSAAPATPGNETQTVPRAWLEIREEWLREKGLLTTKVTLQKQAPVSQQETEIEKAKRAWEKAVAKKTQALEKIQADIDAKDDPAWRSAGHLLKTTGDLESAREFASYLDQRRSLSWNIENCFEKAKANERKIQGSRERLRILEAEVEKLKSRGIDGFQSQRRKQLEKPANKTLLEKAGVKGRKLNLSDGIEAYIGKNAADNLSLLRRAQSHDLWLHLRDYPGSHAIVRIPKNHKVKDSELNEIGKWVAFQSLNKSENELSGLKFDLIVAECRFVRPIKGDKLGRVNYQNERIFIVRI